VNIKIKDLWQQWSLQAKATWSSMLNGKAVHASAAEERTSADKTAGPSAPPEAGAAKS
jgi:hypothetical protein